MTEEKLRRMMKYAELIRCCAFDVGAYGERKQMYDYYDYQELQVRYDALCDYLIHRMEREMKR